MSWRKQKYAQQKTFEQLPLYSIKATHTWLLPSETVLKQIFNSDHKLYTLQKYVVCKFQLEIGHTFTEISNSRGFYRFFLFINAISFCFHFLQGMLSHPLCYLKRLLFKTRILWSWEHHEFTRFFLWGRR